MRNGVEGPHISTTMNDEYFVYMMTSNNHHALYIGVTSELERRVWEHRNAEIKGFTCDYHCVHLVFFESYRDVRDALAREKQLKGWRRKKKNRLIAKLNPHWHDLAEEWF